MKRLVYLEDNDPLIADMFLAEGWEVSDQLYEADLVCFGGGSDVSPDLYMEANTYSQNTPARDLKCVGLYTRAKAMDIPCVGICRGGQFLNVMNGGRMKQHIDGHGFGHKVTIIKDDLYDYKGVEFQATSTHHQEIIPEQEYADIIGVGPEGVTEVVYYGDNRDLCFQPHPEYSGAQAEACRGPFFEMIEDMLDDTAG